MKYFNDDITAVVVDIISKCIDREFKAEIINTHNCKGIYVGLTTVVIAYL